MTIDDFRRVALSMPGAEELSGMGYPNFRAERKSFATIEDDVAILRLSQHQQARLIATAPEMFAPASSGWGRLGSTIVRLEAAEEAEVRDAVATAWHNVSTPTADAVKVTDVGDIDVPATASEVAIAAADVADVPAAADAVPDAKVADAVAADVRDTCNVADVDDGADVANVAVVNVAAEVEPRDNLQRAIERLQAYCGKEPTR
jgi:hypothetical protein